MIVAEASSEITDVPCASIILVDLDLLGTRQDLLIERVTWPRFVATIAVWAVMLLGGHPETVAHINNWVKERTRGLIPTVIEDAPEGAGLVAINALYFKDRWKTPFDPAAFDQFFSIPTLSARTTSPSHIRMTCCFLFK